MSAFGHVLLFSSPLSAMPPSLNHDNTCPSCWAYLIIKFAAGGYAISAGTFHEFPLRDALPTVAHIPPHPNWTPPASISRAPHPSAANERHSSTGPNKPDCARQDCHRKVSPACSHSRWGLPSRWASSHPSHNSPGRETPSTRCGQTSPKFFPHSPPTSSSHSLSPTITPRPSATQQGLIYDPQLEEMQDLIQDEELRQYFGPQPLPIEPMTAQEEQELKLAMRLSKATYKAQSSSTSSSSSAGPSRSSSVGSFTAPSHSAPISGFSTHSRPVGMLKPVYPGNKVPSSTTPVPPRLSQPKKTTQMSASWMREYKDQTAADAAAIKRGKYKSALDLLHKKVFYLVFWAAVRRPSMHSPIFLYVKPLNCLLYFIVVVRIWIHVCWGTI
ncbi:hypothetical protein B0H14DRAFT_2570391 [Mycena olivaceomarginata]|nr:hypothetical protein B0H14DRAFT_2570391 [Mycena olivaceomarginata]